MRLELHCHSTASDGGDSPAEVARAAAAVGVELFCLTDHDTCAGTDEVRAALAEAAPQTQVLRGVEVSAHDGGRTVHLLVFDVARHPSWATLEHRLAEQAVARRTRIHHMLARLAQRGIVLELAAVEREANGAVLGRPHLARALVREGHATSVSEVFDRWLGDGGVADVPLDRFGVGDVLELAEAARAKVSLAHPHTLGATRTADLLARHKAAGLGAIEALYGRYGSRERADWLSLASAHGVVATAGSDYHGAHMPEVLRPGVEVDAPHEGPLREWLGLG